MDDNDTAIVNAIAVVDSHGRKRIVIGCDSNDNPSIQLLRPDGEPLASIWSRPDGSSGLFLGLDDTPGVMLQVYNNNPSFILHNADFSESIISEFSDLSGPEIRVIAQEMQLRLSLSEESTRGPDATTRGENVRIGPQLQLTDKTCRRVILSLEESGIAGLEISDVRNEAGGAMLIKKNGDSFLRLFDSGKQSYITLKQTQNGKQTLDYMRHGKRIAHFP